MKKLGLKNVYLYFSSVCIFLLHMPFVFAKVKPAGRQFYDKPEQPSVSLTDPILKNLKPSVNLKVSVYDSLRLGSLGLGRQVFDYAMKGFSFMKEMGKLGNDQIISIHFHITSDAVIKHFIIIPLICIHRNIISMH